MPHTYKAKRVELVGADTIITYETFLDETHAFTNQVSFMHQTTAQRDALTPFLGHMIYNTTTNQPEFWDGAAWQSMKGA